MLINALADIDITILRWIHHERIPGFDQALYYLSYSASFVSIGLVLTVLIIALKEKSKPLRITFYKMLSVLIVAAILSFTLKNLITRERPFKTYDDIEKLSEAGSSSFPSGHTLEAFAISVAFAIAFPKKRFMIPLFIWALLVAYSRMALGVHYPTDVLGGIILGSLTGWLVPGWIKTRRNV